MRWSKIGIMKPPIVGTKIRTYSLKLKTTYCYCSNPLNFGVGFGGFHKIMSCPQKEIWSTSSYQKISGL